MRIKHIYMLLMVVTTFLIVGCPEPTKDKGSTAPPTIKQLLGSLATAVDMPETTDDEKVKKQNKILSIYALIRKVDPKYKHKPKDKDELATFIKAEIWAQGEKGKQDWEADLNSIDTSEITDMSYLFSNNKDEGYGLHEYNGLPPLWTLNNPTTTVDMYEGSQAQIPTWYSIEKLKPEVEKESPSQADIKALINKITKGNPDYKHRPKNKDELVTIIKAEIWAQGTGGQNWKSDLKNIDTQKIKDMSYLFSADKDKGYGLHAFNGNISKWDVSNVTTMYAMFYKAKAFNQPLNEWDVSSVTTMRSMFYNAEAFNQPLDNWDVSSVETMQTMFFNAIAFNKPLNGWGEKVSKVKTMYGMFWEAEAFNQPLDKWDVSSVETMYAMFYKAKAFNQPLNGWGEKVSKVKTMYGMFWEAIAFNQPLDKWDVSSVETMHSMFRRATAFNGKLNGWGEKVSKVKDMSLMFSASEAFNQPLNEWDVSSVTTMFFMFRRATAFNGKLNGWGKKVGGVKTMKEMFGMAFAFNQPLDKWDVSSVRNMDSMFRNAKVFNQPLDKWDVSKVTNMQYMFQGAIAFNQPPKDWAEHLKGKNILVTGIFLESKVTEDKKSEWHKAIK